MMRALRRLPGCLGSFMPGRIGANHGRLRHVGLEKSCHGTHLQASGVFWRWVFD